MRMARSQQIPWGVQVAITPIFRYSTAIARWDSQEIVKLIFFGCVPSRKHGIYIDWIKAP